jgi:hypothetical protein
MRSALRSAIDGSPTTAPRYRDGEVRRTPARPADLHQPAEIEHRDTVGQISHDAKIVGYEDIADLPIDLELDQEVEDRRLHRNIERGGRLIADDDARIAGEGARDRDALLEAARELSGRTDN